MTKSEKLFLQIIEGLSNGIEGRMFGAKCIKSTKGKTAAFFWQENMVFKLDQEAQDKALKLCGSKIGSHLYAPEKPMKGWVSIPRVHSDKWAIFAEKSLTYVETLKN